jgi:hypothetical protein
MTIRPVIDPGIPDVDVEGFTSWLAIDEHEIEMLLTFDLELPSSDLPYSVDMLDVVEARLLDRFAGPEDMLVDEEGRQFYDRCVRFYADTLIQHLDGYWHLVNDINKSNASQPVISFIDSPFHVLPFRDVRTAVQKRTGTTLRTLFQNQREMQGNS